MIPIEEEGDGDDGDDYDDEDEDDANPADHGDVQDTKPVGNILSLWSLSKEICRSSAHMII